MNVAELDDDAQKISDSDEFQTPTNLSSSNLVKFNLGPDENAPLNDTEDEQDTTINESINTNVNENRPNLINSYSNSMPQFPLHNFQNPNPALPAPFIHHGISNANLNTYFNLPCPVPDHFILKNIDEKENQRRAMFGLYNDLKFNQYNFHSLETFGFFVRYSLSLSPELCKEILSNHKILHWLDRNKADGFVYHTLPKREGKKKMLPVRCDMCKFYGHLSHNCSIKEQSFKLYNVALKSGACRCHICGQLGHPAESGLCLFISCSFCRKYGHWNHMCPNIDKVSRTLCHKCQRYGHTTERCPDQWRQFDRISTLEQTPYKDPSTTNKPVYCYQCAKQGHYGHNCPDFYRKYFIRDNHQLNPVYFFAGSSPFVKNSVPLNETDKKLIEHLVEKPIEDVFRTGTPGQDPLEMLENFQAKLRQEAQEHNQLFFNEIFNPAQMYSNNVGFKKYIRRWSSWVIDFNWIYSLKFFLENLHESKMFHLIKSYPILDNYVLHWMWWCYSLNKDMEFYTKDAFRGVGSMPWLLNDDINNNNKKKKNLNKKKKKKLHKTRKDNVKKKIIFAEFSTHMFDSDIFKTKFNRRSISFQDFLYQNELKKYNRPDKLKYEEAMVQIKHEWQLLDKRKVQFSMSRQKSKSIDFSELDLKAQESNDDENTEDLEITIVYLDKEKARAKADESKKDNDFELEPIESNDTSVFTKFVKSFSLANAEPIKKDTSFDKLVDILKNSNKSKEESGVLAIPACTDDVSSKLDSAPTVEQIETEIFSSKPNSESSDLIKFLLKIDQNPHKIKNPCLTEVYKSSNQVEPGPVLLNKILNTPINVDIVNQNFLSSSSSSGFSSSSISPQPLSSNPSPNTSSSNSSTAKPGNDSSFSTSCSSKLSDPVSTSSLSLSSSSSSVSIESTGNKQLEKLRDSFELCQKDTILEEQSSDKSFSFVKPSKFKQNVKNNPNKFQYLKNASSKPLNAGYQNRSFTKPNYNNSMIKQQNQPGGFRPQQYHNRQFLNVQSKFPKSNSLPSSGKNSNPFSSNYVYSMQKANSSMAQPSSLQWQQGLIANDQANQFGFQNRNAKFRHHQFNNSAQNLREKKDFRDPSLVPFLHFQNIYPNSTSSSNSSTPSVSFSSASSLNNFHFQKSASNLALPPQQNFKRNQSVADLSHHINQMGQKQAQIGYPNRMKNTKK